MVSRTASVKKRALTQLKKKVSPDTTLVCKEYQHDNDCKESAEG